MAILAHIFQLFQLVRWKQWKRFRWCRTWNLVSIVEQTTKFLVKAYFWVVVGCTVVNVGPMEMDEPTKWQTAGLPSIVCSLKRALPADLGQTYYVFTLFYCCHWHLPSSARWHAELFIDVAVNSCRCGSLSAQYHKLLRAGEFSWGTVDSSGGGTFRWACNVNAIIISGGGLSFSTPVNVNYSCDWVVVCLKGAKHLQDSKPDRDRSIWVL